MMCAGFWVGCAISLLIPYSPFTNIFFNELYSPEQFKLTTVGIFMNVLFDGLSASGVTWVINSYVEKNLTNTDL